LQIFVPLQSAQGIGTELVKIAECIRQAGHSPLPEQSGQSGGSEPQLTQVTATEGDMRWQREQRTSGIRDSLWSPPKAAMHEVRPSRRMGGLLGEPSAVLDYL